MSIVTHPPPPPNPLSPLDGMLVHRMVTSLPLQRCVASTLLYMDYE